MSIYVCIEEGSTNCIFGDSGCGKSTFAETLGKKHLSPPIEGKVHHESGIRVAYFDADVIE